MSKKERFIIINNDDSLDENKVERLVEYHNEHPDHKLYLFLSAPSLDIYLRKFSQSKSSLYDKIRDICTKIYLFDPADLMHMSRVKPKPSHIIVTPDYWKYLIEKSLSK